jgi:hypothetical protein
MKKEENKRYKVLFVPLFFHSLSSVFQKSVCKKEEKKEEKKTPTYGVVDCDLAQVTDSRD